MSKSLVIVESPAKAKTIGKYLGKEFVVKASLGHVKDLPKKDLSVDVDNEFKPVYEGLMAEHFVQRQNGTISLTRAGLLQVDHFLSEFFEPELKAVRYV